MTGDAADMIVIAMKENRGGSGSALNKKSGEVNIERISDLFRETNVAEVIPRSTMDKKLMERSVFRRAL